MPLKTPILEHVCDLTVDLSVPREMGRGRGGLRRIIPIVGGTVKGPRLNGTILNIGADWQTVFADGMAQLDTRYSFETGDGAIIEIVNFGHRHGSADVVARVAAGRKVDPNEYYMRTHARLETGDPRYEWVNKALFLGTGARLKESVIMSLFEIK